MLINAELLLQYQRCKRRPFLDIHQDRNQRANVSDLLHKLQQDKNFRKKKVLAKWIFQQPDYPRRDTQAGKAATVELMRQGVASIHQGVLQVNYDNKHLLLSCPDLLIKQPGNSHFGDWVYMPASIELGKRPKQEYQILAAFHAYVLSQIQGILPPTALLLLRGKDTEYQVELTKWIPLMHEKLLECIQAMELQNPPELFISRQKCSLCHWHGNCYADAKSQKHLSLLPGVTPIRYTQLQDLGITSPETLAATNPELLEDLPGFDRVIAAKIVLQAQSFIENRPFVLPQLTLRAKINPTGAQIPKLKIPSNITEINPYNSYKASSPKKIIPKPSSLSRKSQIFAEDIVRSSPIELYFDIEAQPDLNLNYLLGVLVVNKETNTEEFHSFLAEKPKDEKLIWRQFLDLMWQYPEAPIYHFCVYEFDTVKSLGKLYRTPQSIVKPILSRFVDIYEQLTQSVTLPVESYALKAIAKWLGFKWRNTEASGAKCIYWYDQWLKTGDRNLLDIIQIYNEDDCRATHSVKNWLVEFVEKEYPWGIVSTHKEQE